MKKTKKGGTETLGYVWARMPMHYIWRQYLARIDDGCLLFCRKITSNDYLYQYVLYGKQFDTMDMKIEKLPINKIKTVTGGETNECEGTTTQVNPFFNSIPMAESTRAPGSSHGRSRSDSERSASECKQGESEV